LEAVLRVCFLSNKQKSQSQTVDACCLPSILHRPVTYFATFFRHHNPPQCTRAVFFARSSRIAA
jgi:hypothetical protein